MRKRRFIFQFFILLLTVLASGERLLAQPAQPAADTSEFPYWIEMMQDPKANFFQTQRAFELYWEGREITKGCGWKPFKRWESFMESRVDERGNKPAPDHNLKAYLDYYGKRDKAFSDSGYGDWKELGPVFMPNNGTGQPNGLGRVNCVAFHPVQTNTIYIGAPSGGFWRTTDGGTTWETTTDQLPTLGVSSIAVNAVNPHIILIGTGDRDAADAPGIGVMKSTDGGSSWALSNTGMGNMTVGRMLFHPNDTAIVLAATSGGIYRSTDGGSSWIKTSSNTKHYKDLAFKPADPDIVYATEEGNFYRSVDNGQSWTQITTGLSSNITRMVIGVSPANPDYVYCLGVDDRVFEGLYRSTNSGLTFTQRSNTPNIMDYSTDGSGTGGQGWYDLCIAVDPANAEIIYSGGVNIFKSVNGGTSWALTAHWTGGGGAPAVHADHHELIFSPHSGRLYNGNDGGLYYTANGGFSWKEVSSGLAIAQVYKLGQSTLSPRLSINGYQDNGTAIYNGGWSTEIGGDGMECIVDPSDTNYLYGALYYGDVRRSSNNGQNFNRIAKDGSNGITEDGAWITPYILDIVDPGTMYIGYKNIWKSDNIKASSASSVSWTQLSNNLLGSNSNTIRVLEQSPADPDILYFSRVDSRLFRCDNLQSPSPSFTNLTGLPTPTWPVDIEAHPTDPAQVWVVQSNGVFHSSNKGGSWTDVTGSLPNVSVNCIVFDETSNGDLYVGTDLGVYYKGTTMSDWVPFNNGLPFSVEVTELEIYYDVQRSKSRLKASTYGRGLWESELYLSPQADFSAPLQNICAFQKVRFEDHSAGSYNYLSWTFPGGVPSFSTERNPEITYPAAGAYDVYLKVSNDHEADSTFKTTYITVSPAQVTVSPDSAVIRPGESVTLTASGSVNYTWSPAAGLDKTSGSIVVASPVISTVYYVYGDNGGSCDTSQSFVGVQPVGVEEISTSPIRIYPNPTSGKLFIDFGETEGGVFDIRIHDLTGRLLFGRQVEFAGEGDRLLELDLQHLLDRGVFLLQVGNGREQTVVRLLFR